MNWEKAKINYFSLKGMIFSEPKKKKKIVTFLETFECKDKPEKKCQMKSEKKSEYYNNFYLTHNVHRKSNHSFFNHSSIWNFGVNICNTHHFSYVVELGCGTGQFAKCLKDNYPNIIKYWGYDFSFVALHLSNKLVNDSRYSFHLENLNSFHFSEKKPDNTLYILFSFLESIKEDKHIFEIIPKNEWVLFSVANHWCESYLRIFSSKEEIKKIYGSFFSVLYINEVKKRTFPDVFFVCYGKKR
jgi:SAM-dependent methyltransferase